MSKNTLTSTEAANYLGVSRSSLVGWMKQGLIQGEATPGGHYRFTFSVLDRFARQRGIAIPNRPGYQEEQPKILVIEDDPAFRSFIRDALEIFPRLQIQEAADGMQGALLLGIWNPTMIILDIRMPNVNGIEFLRLLRKNPATCNMKILVVSAQLSDDVREELRSLNVENMLEKPVRLSNFLTEFQTLLGPLL